MLRRQSGHWTDVKVENVWIGGFVGENAAAIDANNLYRSRFVGNLFLNNFDAVRLGHNAINNEVSGNFIREWRRHGVSIVGTYPDAGAYSNVVSNNVIDEPVPLGGGEAGVHLAFAHLTDVEGNHFERAFQAICVGCGAGVCTKTTLRNNLCSAGTGICWRIKSASDTMVMSNKRNVGDARDEGLRSTYLFDASAPISGSRDSIQLLNSSGALGIVARAIDVNGAEVANVAAVSGFETLVLRDASQVIRIGRQAALLRASGVHVVERIEGPLSPGSVVRLVFATSGVTLVAHTTGPASNAVRLSAGALEWKPGSYDSITLLRLEDSSWLEVGRTGR